MGRHRRVARASAPVRTGLLGASAALAVGTLAVTGGLIPRPGGDYTVGSAPGPTSRAVPDGPAHTTTTSAAPATPLPDRSPRPSSSQAPPRREQPHASRSAQRSTPPPAPSTSRSSRAATQPDAGPASPTGTPVGGDATAAAAEAEVLELVNAERAQAGCRPLEADPALADLAGDYSREMAEEGFFSHTTPDGLSPWDRAEAAGIDDLGGENIARGQQDAQAVMDAWMHSDGHRANILNCDFTELGVGVSFGPDGPWWTQDFGY